MIIHILIDIPQKARSHHTNSPKRNTRQIHPLVALGKRRLARRHHHAIRRLVALDAGDKLELVEQGRAGEGDGFADEGGVFDAQVQGHGAADVVFGVGDKFVDEDVVVGRVADGAADDADGEGEGRDGGDEVLWGGLVKQDFGGPWFGGTYVWADDGGDDRGWNDNTANADAGKNEKTPDLVEIVDAGDGEASAS